MSRLRALRTWLSKQLLAFKAWREANARAHERAPTRPCCSRPPPSSGKSSKSS